MNEFIDKIKKALEFFGNISLSEFLAKLEEDADWYDVEEAANALRREGHEEAPK